MGDKIARGPTEFIMSGPRDKIVISGPNDFVMSGPSNKISSWPDEFIMIETSDKQDCKRAE